MVDGRTRVLVVVSNLEYGGAQRQIVELVNNLDPGRYVPHIASLSDYTPLRAQVRSGVPVHVVHKRSRFDLTVVLRLRRLVDAHGFHILHTYLFDAEIAARLTRLLSPHPVRVIASERSSNYRYSRIQRVAYRLTRGLFDLSIANSHAGAAFNSRVLGIPPEKYRIVHNGVDSERFRPRDRVAARERLRLPRDVKLLGVFASFKAQKNHALLLRAVLAICGHHPDLRLLLVGDMLYAGVQGSDRYRMAVTTMIRGTSLQGICILFGNRRNVEELYPACDATVLPSRAEGLPNVILESMACGVPVVATRISDNDRVVLDGETGFIVESGDEAGLASALDAMLSDDRRRREMGRRCRARAVTCFSSRKLAGETARVYDELMPAVRPGAPGMALSR